MPHALRLALLLLSCLITAGMSRAAGPVETIYFGMGCFWGAEKRLGDIPGVIEVQSGYANGDLKTADHASVAALERVRRSGQGDLRNHAEVVKVSFDPARVPLDRLLGHFWENHDPTQGDRQGNDIGSQYRSAIYTTQASQRPIALKSRDAYQAALSKAGYGKITTGIEPLKNYIPAEEEHQAYLKKNPNGYCGLQSTGVAHPVLAQAGRPLKTAIKPLESPALNFARQLIVFEAEDCAYCKQFKAEILDRWQSAVPVTRTLASQPPVGWSLDKALFATPTIVLFEKGREVSRFTGYNGDQQRFWKWLGFQTLTPEQRKIAFQQGTESPFSGSHLDEKRPGTFVDPITGAPLFRSDTKFDSGTGWPSFFNPVEGALTLHPDNTHGMQRIEVRSASSGIHLGHVFPDGPPPSGMRYCINGNVLKFVPDAPAGKSHRSAD